MKSFNTMEAAAYLKSIGTPFSYNTLNLWRSLGRGPKFKKIGKKVFYEQSSLDDFSKGVISFLNKFVKEIRIGQIV